jgi:thiamine-monophosphate kinase
MNENDVNQEIESIGEFGLIDLLTNDVELRNESSVRGIGDDAAVILANDTTLSLLSADMMVEGVHFNLSYMPLKSLGFKAVSVNVSDVLAMNGLPEQVTVSLGVSSKFPIEALKELYKGIHAACEFYHVDLIGGDTTSSYSGLIVSISVLGKTDSKKVVYRDGAKENDLLLVTGDIGSSYLGLQILEREKGVFNENPSIQPKLDGYDELIKKQLQPVARQDIISLFDELSFVPTSMIDVSDGLASEVLHLSKSSGCSFSVYSDKLPITEKSILTAEELGLDPFVCALNGGEDYELLFTASQDDYDKFKNNPNFTIIGFATDASNANLLIDKNDTAVTLKAQGWKHF